MIIAAKFDSTCPACGERVSVGQRVEWERGQKAKHISCANGRTQGAPKAPQKSTVAPKAPRKRYPESAPQAGAFEIHGKRNGRSDSRYESGACVLVNGRTGDPKYVVVLAHELRAPNEDMGHYDWTEHAWVRTATEAESEPMRARLAGLRAQTAVPALIDRLVTAGERVPEELAALETVAPVARTAWEWRAPTKPGGISGQLAAIPGLRLERVRVLADGSVVGHHGGQYDDYRPSAWVVRQPSEMLLLAIAALTGDDASIPVVADYAYAQGIG